MRIGPSAKLRGFGVSVRRVRDVDRSECAECCQKSRHYCECGSEWTEMWTGVSAQSVARNHAVVIGVVTYVLALDIVRSDM